MAILKKDLQARRRGQESRPQEKGIENDRNRTNSENY